VRIAIIDYGMGNVRSMANAMEFIGMEPVLSADPGELAQADRLILPGVGAFGDAMAALKERGLVEVLQRLIGEEGKPVLGVCLGMQLFARSSEEHGGSEGLGLIAADVKQMRAHPPAKIPHVGWNDLSFDTDDWLFEGIPASQPNFYFVHSLQMVCDNPATRIATCDHGTSVTAAVRQDNIVATQFHPEKSQDNGIRLLMNWADHDFAGG
jgi:glutamine amidotransferase